MGERMECTAEASVPNLELVELKNRSLTLSFYIHLLSFLLIKIVVFYPLKKGLRDKNIIL